MKKVIKESILGGPVKPNIKVELKNKLNNNGGQRQIPVIDGPINNPEYGKNMSRSKSDLNPKPKIDLDAISKYTDNNRREVTMKDFTPEIKKDKIEVKDKVEKKPLTTREKFNKKFIKKDKGVGFVKRGTPGAQRAENKEKAKNRAKEMAKARIAAKKKAEMSEGMAGALIKGGSKLVPALMTGIGAVGTMMQSKKKQGTKGGQGFGGEKPANAEVKAPKKVKKPRLNIGKRASGRDRNFIQGGGAGGMESVEYDAYDLGLEYLISTEQAATIEEANYVMTEMDAETIQGIVEEQKKNFDEGLASMALKTGLVVGGAALAKKGLDKAKKSFDNYLNKQRDKGIGGNTRPGSDKMYYGDKK